MTDPKNMPSANKDQGSGQPAVNRFLYGKAFNSTRAAPNYTGEVPKLAKGAGC